MSKRHETSRRNFLKTSAAVAAAGAAAPYFAWSQPAFANQAKNDRPVIGCIGVGSMGTGDAQGHNQFGDIVAVCDVDETHRERAKNDGNIGKGKADSYEDYRKVLERQDIEVVSVVTPDHWHVKIAIEALEAGKHVFCQKPLTLTLEENQLVQAACKKYDKQVFFIGTQQRSERPTFLRAVNMVHKGLLGDIQTVTCSIGGGDVGGPFKTEEPPKTLNWEMWQGQAEANDFIKERCHYQFRWWYEYSGGKFTDWGAHHVDIALWALNQNNPGDGPSEIDGSDAKHPVEFQHGYPTVKDKYNTAHDYNIVCKYGDTTVNVTSRGDNGILIEGSKGRIFVTRGKIAGKPIEENWDKDQFTDAEVVKLYKGKPYEGHKNNFYRCIAEGGLPVSDVFTHTQAMGTCHLSAIAARLGRKLQWDAKGEKFVGDEEAQKFFARTPRKGFEIPRVS